MLRWTFCVIGRTRLNEQKNDQKKKETRAWVSEHQSSGKLSLLVGRTMHSSLGRLRFEAARHGIIKGGFIIQRKVVAIWIF